MWRCNSEITERSKLFVGSNFSSLQIFTNIISFYDQQSITQHSCWWWKSLKVSYALLWASSPEQKYTWNLSKFHIRVFSALARLRGWGARIQQELMVLLLQKLNISTYLAVTRSTLAASESSVKFKSSVVTIIFAGWLCLRKMFVFLERQVAGGDNNKFSQQ